MIIKNKNDKSNIKSPHLSLEKMMTSSFNCRKIIKYMKIKRKKDVYIYTLIYIEA